jgi:uncharacterized membrane protein
MSAEKSSEVDPAASGVVPRTRPLLKVRGRAAGIRPDGTVDQHGLAARRLVVAGLAAVVTLAAALLAGVSSAAVAADASWDGAALVFLVWVWVSIGGKDADETARMANAEDVSQPLADLILLTASIASLVAVGFVLSEASHHSGSDKGLLIGLALVSVALAWASVHTVYMLRYGDLYYRAPVGGIDFHADERPDYGDLAYLALTIGMTFQVSDTDLIAKSIRRTAIRHALLSFLFGAVIVAITINVVASLLNR